MAALYLSLKPLHFSLCPLPPSVCSALAGNDGSCLVTNKKPIRLVPALSSCFTFVVYFRPPLSRVLSRWVLVFFNRTPPWFGRGWAASGRPASPGTGCGSESGSRPWSRRKKVRWCESGTGASCRRTPL